MLDKKNQNTKQNHTPHTDPSPLNSNNELAYVSVHPGQLVCHSGNW